MATPFLCRTTRIVVTRVSPWQTAFHSTCAGAARKRCRAVPIRQDTRQIASPRRARYDPAMPGGFFVFEGIDGCGKSTQSRLLALELRRRGIATEAFREPGNTEIGEAVRQLLLDPRHRE